MKKLILIFISIIFISCNKEPIYPKRTVIYSCSGGSGNYTMTYSSGNTVQQGNYSSVTYHMNYGEYSYVNAMDNNGNTFTLTETVDGVVYASYTGTILEASYDYK